MSAIDKLTSLVDSPERYAIPQSDLLPLQIAAANELFSSKLNQISLLRHRAESGEVTEIRDVSDIVPLLFAHTAYKSYPERWLRNGDWKRMSKWLGTVSSHPVENVDLENIDGIDDWLSRLESAGHYVSCTSGTSGKSAMLNASLQDIEWTKRETVASVAWGLGIEPAQDRRMFALAPVASVPKNHAVRNALAQAFGIPGAERFTYPVPEITIGRITEMVTLRQSIADGSATPEEIAEYERITREREEAVENAAGIAARALVEAREDKLFLTGMWTSLFQIAEAVREMGYSGKDFHPENVMYVGGGLKGSTLPDNYREVIFDTFNLRPDNIYHMYGMQEINSALPRCEAGRYHAPAWLMVLLLDESGDNLVPVTEGEMEGRAAFLDLSLDGRWGGVISGDKIQVDYGTCDCGNAGPSIRDNIVRFAELPGGDKISCSGTIDAYVRGVA